MIVDNDEEDIVGSITQVCRMILDDTYNILVCEFCKTGIPFDQVIGHLKKFHGIVKTLNDIRIDYHLSDDSMTTSDIKNWFDHTTFLEHSIINIPTIKGLYCEICQYAAVNKSVMRNHFSANHKDVERQEYCKECLVSFIAFC